MLPEDLKKLPLRDNLFGGAVMNKLISEIKPKITPSLDKGFIPASLVNKAFKEAVKNPKKVNP